MGMRVKQVYGALALIADVPSVVHARRRGSLLLGDLLPAYLDVLEMLPYKVLDGLGAKENRRVATGKGI